METSPSQEFSSAEIGEITVPDSPSFGPLTLNEYMDELMNDDEYPSHNRFRTQVKELYRFESENFDIERFRNQYLVDGEITREEVIEKIKEFYPSIPDQVIEDIFKIRANTDDLPNNYFVEIAFFLFCIHKYKFYHEPLIVMFYPEEIISSWKYMKSLYLIHNNQYVPRENRRPWMGLRNNENNGDMS